MVRPRQARPPTYGPGVVLALRFCWAVLGAPTGKRLATVLAELVPTLRRFGELPVSDELAGQLVAMSPATIDRGWPVPGPRWSCAAAAIPSPGRCSRA